MMEGNRQQLLLDLEERHEREIKELEMNSTAMLKAAKKSNKAQIEAQVIQMHYDLRAKHRDEIEELENGNETNPIDAVVEFDSRKKIDNTKNLESQAALEVEKKKEKAKSKQKKRAAKDAEKLKQYEEMKLNSGPSLRDLEIDKINMKLKDDSMQIKTILSDGNCLYRAIADQLQLIGQKEDEAPDWIHLRVLAANYIRNDPKEYAPFLGLSNSMNAEELIQFHDYCDRVESPSLAEWGGQLEIQALSKCLQRTILVVSADSPTLRMGLDDDDGSDSIANKLPLRISYHKHFYALGAHYNSLVPIE